MKCAYHPNKDATAHCSQCQKPLCEQCAIHEGHNSFICSRCAVLKSAQDAVEGIDQRLEEKKVKRQIQEAKRKKRPLLRSILISLAVGIIIVNVFLYFRSTIPGFEEFIASQQRVVTAIIIDEAIQDYAEDSGGIFPQSLSELLGKYISADKITPNDLKDFRYRRISPHSYELRPKKMDDEMIEDLTFTEERPKP